MRLPRLALSRPGPGLPYTDADTKRLPSIGLSVGARTQKRLIGVLVLIALVGFVCLAPRGDSCESYLKEGCA